MTSNQRKKGEAYEQLAAEHLRRDGYYIIAQNYRSGRHEIDIICCKGNQLVFVEVKGSASESFGDASYKVNHSKQQSIIAAAQGFIQNSNVDYESYRFDVIVITEKAGKVSIEHCEGAFTL